MHGSIGRTQQGGATLCWKLSNNKSAGAIDHDLAPAANAHIDGAWITVAPGDTLDFVLRAPNGDACGGVEWNLRVAGRESADAPIIEIGNLREQFPTPDSPPPAPFSADPWADLIQMLWASNEFHFID
jgi:hypothetical protein